jgi:hypothetical protein
LLGKLDVLDMSKLLGHAGRLTGVMGEGLSDAIIHDSCGEVMPKSGDCGGWALVSGSLLVLGNLYGTLQDVSERVTLGSPSFI